MRSRTGLALAVVLALAFAGVAVPNSEEPLDLAMVTRIRVEGLTASRVMDTVGQLTDVIGPRLTGSPNMRRANEWTREQLASWGLANARVESWGAFGRGWSLERATVHMVAPESVPLVALPKAWTPATSGPLRGKALQVKFQSEEDLERNKGRLAGAILFLSDARELKAPEKALFKRYSDDALVELGRYEIGEQRRGGPPGDREAARQRFLLQAKLRPYFVDEKVLATVEPSDRDGGVVRVMGGGSREKDEDPGVPALVMAAEQYNRVLRLLERKQEVELEIDVKARFHDEDATAANTFAEIPGSDRRGELVMLGAHLDSWHAGTGATDNAAGSAVVMEAMRILKALDVKPRRTIRAALWSGEEQGLLGSRAYVSQHFASRPEPEPSERSLPRWLRRERGPLTVKPDHAKLSVYFNLDAGTGKIRGVYAQENAAAVPIFEAWLRPFADLGAGTVTLRGTGGTDHVPFDAAGLPGFQFIQDEADYATRTHHTNMDVFDRLQREDLMQASVIMASFAYHAAMRDGMFPRKPLPKDAPPPEGPLPPGLVPTPAPGTPTAGVTRR
jgi:hypothetical protein